MREKERLDREETSDLARRISESDVTGAFDTGTDYQGRPMVVPTERRKERETREELARAELTGDLGGTDTLASQRGQREERALTDDLVTSREARRSSADDRSRKDRALDIDERRIDAEIDRMKGQTRDDRLKTLSTIAENGETGNELQKALEGLAGDEGLERDEFTKIIRESLGLRETGNLEDDYGIEQYSYMQLNEDLKSDDPSIRKRAEDRVAKMLAGIESRTIKSSYTVGGRA